MYPQIFFLFFFIISSYSIPVGIVFTKKPISEDWIPSKCGDLNQAHCNSFMSNTVLIDDYEKPCEGVFDCHVLCCKENLDLVAMTDPLYIDNDIKEASVLHSEQGFAFCKLYYSDGRSLVVNLIPGIRSARDNLKYVEPRNANCYKDYKIQGDASGCVRIAGGHIATFPFCVDLMPLYYAKVGFDFEHNVHFPVFLTPRTAPNICRLCGDARRARILHESQIVAVMNAALYGGMSAAGSIQGTRWITAKSLLQSTRTARYAIMRKLAQTASKKSSIPSSLRAFRKTIQKAEKIVPSGEKVFKINQGSSDYYVKTCGKYEFQMYSKATAQARQIAKEFPLVEIPEMVAFERVGNQYKIVMKPARGVSLQDVVHGKYYLAKPPTLARPITAAEFEQFKGAIERLNSKGVYHLDLTPQNIYVRFDSQNRARFAIIDWGGPMNRAGVTDVAGLERLERTLRNEMLLL